MQGYVARKGDRYYAVIYEGTDPVTGRERRRWHPAGTDRVDAERLAAELARRRHNDGYERSSLTVAVYLAQRWLPSKKLTLRTSTHDSYRRNIELHVTPAIGRVSLRRLRPDHLERFYADLADHGRMDGKGGLNSKTIVEIHMILRRSLDDAVRRGLIVSNPARVAHAPKRRPLSSPTSRVWTAAQLSEFVNGTRSHRYHAALWLAANTGMRRGEVLGLRWGDVDLDLGLLCVTRSLVSVGYELHETRGKSRSARRSINLDPITTELLSEWRQRRCAEDPEFDPDDPEGHVFSRPDGSATHPQLLSDAFKKLVARSGLPSIRFHDLRNTHATLLLKAGVPVKVVSERLGHSTPGFTMATYQHVIPGMQHEAALTFARLLRDTA
jgi:integrase